VSEYDDLLVDAYRGEVLGAALFGAMATARTGDEHTSLLALQRIESTTATRLRTLIDAGGIDAGDDQSAIDDGLRLADATRDQEWSTFLSTLRAALPPFLANFERLQVIGAHGDPVLADLVAHERAIDRFAELTLEGQATEALAVLETHLDLRTRATRSD
jgi:hypothetical protein